MGKYIDGFLVSVQIGKPSSIPDNGIEIGTVFKKNRLGFLQKAIIL